MQDNNIHIGIQVAKTGCPGLSQPTSTDHNCSNMLMTTRKKMVTSWLTKGKKTNPAWRRPQKKHMLGMQWLFGPKPAFPKGPVTKIRGLLGPNNYVINGLWAPKPYYLDPWTLRDCCPMISPKPQRQRHRLPRV